MRIIGITGTIGAGKGTVVEYLISKGFTHYSARTIFLKELEARGLPKDRNYMKVVANELRHKNGPGYVAETLLADAEAAGVDAVIESLRTVGEIETLRNKKPDFFLLAVDANEQLRYERILERGSETDHVSFEEFVRQEEAENKNEDPWKQNILACMQKADALVINNGTKEELFEQVEKVLEV